MKSQGTMNSEVCRMEENGNNNNILLKLIRYHEESSRLKLHHNQLLRNIENQLKNESEIFWIITTEAHKGKMQNQSTSQRN